VFTHVSRRFANGFDARDSSQPFPCVLRPKRLVFARGRRERTAFVFQRGISRRPTSETFVLTPVIYHFMHAIIFRRSSHRPSFFLFSTCNTRPRVRVFSEFPRAVFVFFGYSPTGQVNDGTDVLMTINHD